MDLEPSRKHIPPQHREVVRATEEADPTTFSPLPAESTKKVGEVEGKYMDIVQADGERYIELHGFSGDPSQFVMAKLLKGIVNVSDVVRFEDGKFYSKVMPVDRIQEQTSDAEIDADLFIFRRVLRDGDHRYAPPGENFKGETRNLIRENGKAAYFDFEHAQRLGSYALPLMPSVSVEALQIADDKLRRLRARLDGAMGAAFIQAVIKASRKTADRIFPAFQNDESPTDSLQQTLLAKIDNARAEIAERLARESTEAA